MKRYLCMSGLLLCILMMVAYGILSYSEKNKHTHVFGATYMTKNNPFFVALHEAIEEVVKANGDILISRDPCQDQHKQNEQIYEMIEEGIEVLFLNPVDKKEVKPALQACKDHGVVVINIDTIVEEKEYVTAIVETDNYQAGVLCAQEMMNAKEKARIVIIGNPIQSSMNDRMEGFRDTIADNDNYRIVYEGIGNGEFEVSAKAMEEFVKKGLPFDVILGGNDPSALGALATLRKYDMESGVLIYSIDGSPDFKAMLESGDVTGTCAQSPITIGRIAAEIAYKYRAGEEVPSYVSVEPEMITKENLSEYEINAWQ